MNYHSAKHEKHNDLDALLAGYAVGSLSLPMHAMVASHLVLNQRSRPFVSAMEAIVAAEVENAPEGVIRDRNRRLSQIFATADAPKTAPLPTDDVLPLPLVAYLGRGVADLSWRSVLPGLREAKLAAQEGVETSMLWIKAGRAMPAHTHTGTEATLVLKGSFADAHGLYERGDIAVVDSDVDHKPVAGQAEDCICFVVSEGPVKLTGPVARFFSRLAGH
ncbi:MAG: ChrR family anti-sigma-E factor [Beijerinckiaceae bacterium]